jgi:2'-hydroxyisoflavone reductase
MARGGEVIAPGDPDVAMQLIDARDLAAYLLDSIGKGTAGTYNVSAPTGNATMKSWLTDAATTTGAGAELTWVSDDVLLAHEVEPWTELPLWMPAGQGGDHVWDPDTSGAARTGLTCRPVAETVRDTWAWMQADGVQPDDAEGRFGKGLSGPNGIAPDKEKQILAAWHAR